MRNIEYNRDKVYEYAKKWAYKRNPAYYNFDNLGGDCTNFVSQCIYEGARVMNYTKNYGWYYINANNKAPAWSGVEFLYNFLVNNKSVGPHGEKSNIEQMQMGDIAQLSFDGIKFSHTLIIVQAIGPKTVENIHVATHTYDTFGKTIAEYNFKDIRYIHINGVRKW